MVAQALIAISLGLDLGAPRGGSRQVLERRSGFNGAHAVCYKRELVKCGKKSCDRWHGPYWYAYWRSGRRTKKRYIGKDFHELAALSADLVANDRELDQED